MGVLLKGHVPPRMKFRPWIEKGETQHVSLVGLVVDDFERLDFDGMVRIGVGGEDRSVFEYFPVFVTRVVDDDDSMVLEPKLGRRAG